jgi:hypothetical protein
MGNLVKILVVIIVYSIMFGKLGKSRFRQEIAQALIEWLKKNYA